MGITVENATKRFGDFVALDEVSIEVPDGSLTALLGPSGSGKSTLLRVIAGLEAPDSGRVVISDEDMTNVSVQNRNVGFCFQHYAAFKHMTVGNNVAFGLGIRKRPEERDQPARPRAALAGAARGPDRPLPVAALRRPAPADGARAGARGRAEGAAARRAVRGARRARAHRAAPVAAPTARRGPRDDDLRHPRSGGGDGRRRADRGHERRRGRAGRQPDRSLRPPRDRVRDELRRHREPDRRAARAPARRPDRPRAGARAPRRR